MEHDRRDIVRELEPGRMDFTIDSVLLGTYVDPGDYTFKAEAKFLMDVFCSILCALANFVRWTMAALSQLPCTWPTCFENSRQYSLGVGLPRTPSDSPPPAQRSLPK